MRFAPIVLLLIATLHAGYTVTVAIPSAALARRTKAVAVFPSAYRSGALQFPVVYALHGYGGHRGTWLRIAPLKDYADAYGLIFVCIDGNVDSWYIDSPKKKDSRYETYVVRELVPFVDRTWRTITSDSGRGLLGTSMGGHGALFLLARNPSVFGAAASISGIMDLTEFPGRWGIARVLGPLETNRQQWNEYSFINMTDRLAGAGRTVSLVCGLDDFALNGNRHLHALLQEKAIPHDYRELPGAHNWALVRRATEDQIRGLARALLRAR